MLTQQMLVEKSGVSAPTINKYMSEIKQAGLTFTVGRRTFFLPETVEFIRSLKQKPGRKKKEETT